MAENYSQELLRVAIAQICQTIGYSSTQSAPLELLQDNMKRFIQQFATNLHRQVEHANRVEPSIKDAAVSLTNLQINIPDILNYIENVAPVAFPREIPVYPVAKQNSLIFIKTGSAEALSRPAHIYKYLPTMYPTVNNNSAKRSNQNEGATDNELQAANGELPMTTGDMVSMEGQVRELRSVVMTTDGLIVPAIAGKLPAAFIPNIIDKLNVLRAPPQLKSQPISELVTTKKTAVLYTQQHSQPHIDNSAAAAAIKLLSNKSSKKSTKKAQSEPKSAEKPKRKYTKNKQTTVNDQNRKYTKRNQKLAKQIAELEESLRQVDRDLLLASLPQANDEQNQSATHMLDADKKMKTAWPRWNKYSELPMTSADIKNKSISGVDFISTAIPARLPNAFVTDINNKFKTPIGNSQLDIFKWQKAAALNSQPHIDNSATAAAIELLSKKSSDKNTKRDQTEPRPAEKPKRKYTKIKQTPVNDQADPNAKIGEKHKRRYTKKKLKKQMTELEKSMLAANNEIQNGTTVFEEPSVPIFNPRLELKPINELFTNNKQKRERPPKSLSPGNYKKQKK